MKKCEADPQQADLILLNEFFQLLIPGDRRALGHHRVHSFHRPLHLNRRKILPNDNIVRKKSYLQRLIQHHIVIHDFGL